MMTIQDEYKKKYRDKNPLLSPEAQFAGHNLIERKQKHFTQHDQERPPVFINRPLTRAQIRKKYMRTINKKEIDW
jgi:hypothetical protein